jgi:hypothetical protein
VTSRLYFTSSFFSPPWVWISFSLNISFGSACFGAVFYLALASFSCIFFFVSSSCLEISILLRTGGSGTWFCFYILIVREHSYLWDLLYVFLFRLNGFTWPGIKIFHIFLDASGVIDDGLLHFEHVTIGAWLFHFEMIAAFVSLKIWLIYSF